MLTITDTCEDSLEARILDTSGALDLTITENEKDSCVMFYRGDDDEQVRKLRDLLNDWLDEAPTSSARVAASSIPYNEGVLRLAAVHGRTVEFSYAKGDGNVIERRRLQPQEVREVKDHLIFLGHDPDRDDVRAYRVDRIKGEVRFA